MGSLSNLYISQSYQSLIHIGTDNSASTALTELQDGVGQDLGVFINTNGDLKTTTSVSSSTIEATNLVIKNRIELTGSIDIDGPVTASSAFIENDLIVSGTLFANKVQTLIESSSIIFSSGSNILGDDIDDIQTLIGSVIISGSQSLTGSLQVSNDISASTINGLGNATDFSTSVDSRLDIVEATASLYVPFSQSVDNRLDEVEATASFLNTTFSQSVDFRLDELENFSSSLQTDFATQAELNTTASFLQNEINKKLDTASFNSYTQSTDATIATLATTASVINLSSSVATDFVNSYAYINNASSSISASIIALSASISITDNTQTQRIDGLASLTGSYATTGSNVFVGRQIFSGSVEGSVVDLSIVSSTASMNLLSANFFTITLVSGSNTHISASNITPGMTLSLRITQPSTGYGTATFSPSIRFPQSFPYTATPSGSAVDIISFQTYDASFVYGVAVNTMR